VGPLNRLPHTVVPGLMRSRSHEAGSTDEGTGTSLATSDAIPLGRFRFTSRSAHTREPRQCQGFRCFRGRPPDRKRPPRSAARSNMPADCHANDKVGDPIPPDQIWLGFR